VLVSLVLTFGLLRNDPFNLPLLAISYLIPLIIYSYNYYEEMDRDRLTKPDRTAYLEKRVKIYPFLISGYVASLATLMVLYGGQMWTLYVVVGILVAAGILYTVYLKRLTRYVTGFKTYFVTAEWALATVFLYTQYMERRPEGFPLAIFGFVFLKILVNAVFYDLKDIRSDGREGLKTIPVVLGWDGAIRLLYLFNLASAAMPVIGVLTGELPGSALVLIVFTMYDFYYLIHAERSGEEGMAPKDYAIADYEFILWPWAVGIGLVLLDWFGPLPTAAIVMLIMLGAAKKLFTGHAIVPHPVECPP
jgi:4-hydroxybenzoate polyprenyltransferase